MGRRALTGALAGVAALVLAGQARAECQLQPLAELPVSVQGKRAIVSATVNGHSLRLMIDSGAAVNFLTPAAAAQAEVRLNPGPANVQSYGAGGRVAVQMGTAKRLEMGNLSIPDIDFLVAGGLGPGVDGLIGQNILRVVDVEYDLPHHLMRLMKPKGCEKASLAYWAGQKGIGLVELEPLSPQKPHAVGVVHVNGVSLRAMFDTGAETSVLNLAGAQHAAVHVQGEGVTAAGYGMGVDGRPLATVIAPVSSFEVGGEQIRNTRLRVSSVGVAGLDEPDMLIGLDFFLSHRVLVANSQRRLYFTYEGGPVFDLSTKPTAGAASVGPAVAGG